MCSFACRMCSWACMVFHKDTQGHGDLPWAVAGRRSSSPSRACLRSMHITYITITIVAAFANAYAASMNFVGAESVKAVADKVQVSPRWMIPFGVLLGCGALGLLIGFAVPALGIAAATGLTVYFICALGAHLRVQDPGVGGAISFLVLAVAALIAGIGYHNHW